MLILRKGTFGAPGDASALRFVLDGWAPISLTETPFREIGFSPHHIFGEGGACCQLCGGSELVTADFRLGAQVAGTMKSRQKREMKARTDLLQEFESLKSRENGIYSFANSWQIERIVTSARAVD